MRSSDVQRSQHTIQRSCSAERASAHYRVCAQSCVRRALTCAPRPDPHLRPGGRGQGHLDPPLADRRPALPPGRWRTANWRTSAHHLWRRSNWRITLRILGVALMEDLHPPLDARFRIKRTKNKARTPSRKVKVRNRTAYLDAGSLPPQKKRKETVAYGTPRCA